MQPEVPNGQGKSNNQKVQSDHQNAQGREIIWRYSSKEHMNTCICYVINVHEIQLNDIPDFMNLTLLIPFSRPGGDRIYGVFDNQLPAALRKLPFDRHLSIQNVRKIVSEADGYQPHLIAPEQGYRRLIEGALNYFRGPAEASVDAVSSYFEVYLSLN